MPRKVVLAIFSVGLCALTQFTTSSRALAAFTASTSISQATVSSATLSPPTALSATGGCQALILGPQVKLTWTATPTTFATGYQVLRSATTGGPYSVVSTVSGRTTTTYTDTTVTGLSTTYHYVLKAQFVNWNSVNSTQATGTTPVLCL